MLFFLLIQNPVVSHLRCNHQISRVPSLLAFQIDPSVGQETLSAKHSETAKVHGKPLVNPTIPVKVKAQLLKATQIRNLLGFDGFLKLELPEDQALKQISDSIFIKNHQNEDFV